MGQLKTGCELSISDSFQNNIMIRRFKLGSESGSTSRSESESKSESESELLCESGSESECGSTSGSEFESESKSTSESLVYVDQTLTVAATSCDSFKPAWHFTL